MAVSSQIVKVHVSSKSIIVHVSSKSVKEYASSSRVKNACQRMQELHTTGCADTAERRQTVVACVQILCSFGVDTLEALSGTCTLFVNAKEDRWDVLIVLTTIMACHHRQ